MVDLHQNNAYSRPIYANYNDYARANILRNNVTRLNIFRDSVTRSGLIKKVSGIICV